MASLNKKSKKNVKIFAATAMSIFSLAAVFTATIAWFALNHEVESDGMKIKATINGPAFSSVQVHLLDPDETSTEYVYKFNSTPAVVFDEEGEIISGSGNVKVLDYGDLNKTTPVLLLFKLGVDDATSGNPIGVQASELLLKATTTYTTAVNEVTLANKDSFPLSHAIYFRSGVFSDSTFSFDVVVKDDPNVANDVVGVPYETKFVNVNISNIAEPLSLSSSTLTVYQGSGSTVVKYLAVVMDYYVPAIEALMTANLGNTNISTPYVNGEDSSGGTRTPNRIGFVCDWTMEL